MEQKYKALIYSTYKDVYFEKKMEFTQHDSKTAKILFECYDDINVPMTDIQYAVLNIHRPDGKSYTFGMSYDDNPVFEITNNNVLLILPPAALYVAGKKYEGSIALHGTDGKRLTVTRFTYDVIEDMTSDTPIDETNEFPILTELIDDVTILKDAYKGALENNVNGEVIAARRGEKLLGDRLDKLDDRLDEFDSSLAQKASRQEVNEKINQVDATITSILDEHTSQLADIKTILVNVRSFGALGDGTTDDTLAIKNAISFCKNKNSKLIFPTGNYLVTDLLLIDFSNIEIDFCNSNLIFSSNDKKFGGTYTERCFIKVQGTQGISTKINSFDSLLFDTNGYVNNKHSQIVVANSEGFEVGDYVKINFNIVEGIYSVDSYNPTINIIASIVKIVGNLIYVDYHSPFLTAYLDVSNAYLEKINVLSNIVIKNLNINDISTTMNGNYAVGGISLKYCVNSTIQNITHKNGYYSTIYTIYCQNIAITNVKTNTPRATGGGEGYLTQILNSRYVTVNNAISYNTRHCVDFSMSADCTVDNCNANGATNGGFDMHGICEHNITFRNCNGSIVLGNGIPQFPNLVKDIHFIDSGLYINSMQSGENIKFTNCQITLINGLALTPISVSYDSCEIYLYNKSVTKPSKRGLNTIITKYELTNCKLFNLHEDTSISSFNTTIEGFDIVTLKNNIFDGTKFPNMYFCINENEIVDISNNTFFNQMILLKATNKSVDFRIMENKFKYTSTNIAPTRQMIRVIDFNTASGIVTFENNTFITGVTGIILDGVPTNTTNNLIMVVNNNHFNAVAGTTTIKLSESITGVTTSYYDNILLGTISEFSLKNRQKFSSESKTPYVFSRLTSPTAVRGAIYFDGTENKFKKCTDGTTWIDF